MAHPQWYRTPLSGRLGGETTELVEGTPGGEATPIEAPETPMAAVFELGATQNEVQHLRREVQQCQEEISVISGHVDGLARTVQDLSSSLEAVVEEEEQIVEVIQEEQRASFLDRLLGGHHTPTNRA